MIIGDHRLVPQSEKETFELMKAGLRGAIDDCTEIASQPWSGDQFIRLSRRLRSVEACCRAVAVMRGDARWLPMTLNLAAVQQRARRWLAPATVESKKHFVTLAAVLGQMLAVVIELETRRPPRAGLILPRMGRPDRTGRPMQVKLYG